MPEPSGEQVAVKTVSPLDVASSRRCRSNRVLPTPVGPRTITVVAVPETDSRSRSRSSVNSSSRPTNDSANILLRTGLALRPSLSLRLTYTSSGAICVTRRRSIVPVEVRHHDERFVTSEWSALREMGSHRRVRPELHFDIGLEPLACVRRIAPELRQSRCEVGELKHLPLVSTTGNFCPMEVVRAEVEKAVGQGSARGRA